MKETTQPPKDPKKKLWIGYAVILAIVILSNVFLFPAVMQASVKSVNYSTFLQMLESKELATVQIEDQQIYFVDKNDNSYKTNAIAQDNNLVTRLEDAGVEFGTVYQSPTIWDSLLNLLISFLPMIMLIVGCAAACVLEIFVREKLVARLADKGKLLIGLVAAVAVIAVVYLVAALNVTGSYTFGTEGEFRRAISLPAGDYSLSMQADGSTSVRVTYKNTNNLVQNNETDLASGSADAPVTFTVPEDSKLVFFYFGGEQGDLNMLGIYFVDPGEHIEHRTMVVHNHPDCKSRVVYKGALDGKGAHSTWVGNALIEPTAPGTDSYELNRNLVLTPGAIADSEPNLEIENGNIIGAGHASSVGRFDDEELFYLQSRGIPETEARKLVVRGFFGELVEEIGIPAISEHLMNVIDKRLARGENDAIAQVLEEK